jgi:hypothetical protein
MLGDGSCNFIDRVELQLYWKNENADLHVRDLGTVIQHFIFLVWAWEIAGCNYKNKNDLENNKIGSTAVHEGSPFDEISTLPYY